MNTIVDFAHNTLPEYKTLPAGEYHRRYGSLSPIDMLIDNGMTFRDAVEALGSKMPESWKPLNPPALSRDEAINAMNDVIEYSRELLYKIIRTSEVTVEDARSITVIWREAKRNERFPG